MVIGPPSVSVFSTLPDFDRREILRYAGMRGAQTDAGALPLEECLQWSKEAVAGRAVWRVLPILRSGTDTRLGDICVTAETLLRALEGCKYALLLAATVGLAMDRLMVRYQQLSPARALLLHAIGTERVECLCDQLMLDLNRTKGWRFRPRVSPGYGDWPLTAQRELFALLDCERQIGLTLNESLIMSPSKSVTAVAGILASANGKEITA